MQNLIKKAINRFLRQSINQKNRQHLTNHDMTVISSNCNGAFILHDLGEKFNSPFVNLYLEPADFIKYLQNIDHYMQAKLNFVASDKHYPVGKLEDLTIHFMHYHSEDEASRKWIERTKRMNLDNLFILMTDRDGCTYEHLQAFDALPFPNKIIFTHKKYPEFASSLYIPGFEHQSQVGDLFEFSGWNGKKFYDQLNYVNWFNTGKYQK
ncbi:DUF1919 domain-containing protein [Pasteurella bettyae]|uniref:PF08942 domain protein n=1 Tax=Pasteurella bettyae CCUG 2042 TaxID=1095749 RepID=I3DDD4_9PAST|nr:DUF1919 domain-containing protein [Pasteurella bettyae]EIJ69727.1 PF08942 domain protein [Pasteurella bettyae CCUG 2042]SUB22009.1 Exopolysaccharide biosynthesis protein [Pasteurella bettyae]